ncbi:phosphotransferase family protein [Sphingomonas sp. ID0503]|uniref:phosphotransferase family protein n=1 Tax=Sphingomonas sp. ID0503 TaxID=3399691 RepID=UPI003AFADE55
MEATREAIESRLLELLETKAARPRTVRYIPKTVEEVVTGLEHLFAREAIPARARNVRRMGGGASKEQFVFDLEGDVPPQFARCVLRMDPLEGIIETCRAREAQVLRAVAGVVPVPPVLCVDDGSAMGQPAMITGFVGGVTKPSASTSGPSGVRATMGDRVGAALTPQFIRHLVSIHATDLGSASLPDYPRPRAGTTDAALWQVNYWTKVRELEQIDALPLLTLAETWLYDHLPVCEEPVLLHGDYRIGNFLFDEDSLQITAVLDWELAHIGDFHEDLAYNFEPLFGTRNSEGELMAGSMFPISQLIREYSALTGRVVDPKVLHWYCVLTSYKLIGMNHASSIRAARDGTNHQNALLAFLASCAAGMSDTLCKLLKGHVE